MANIILRSAIRTWFLCTSRRRATRRIGEVYKHYMRIADSIDSDTGTIPVTVPPMPGVDEDMRSWSFFQILEHNAIVNRSIAAVVEALSHDREPAGAGTIDPKTGVMPSPDAGPEQVESFRASVDAYLKLEAGLGTLRGSREKLHPVFGSFDAHKWHCMFGFHLKLHLKQATIIARAVTR